MNLNERKLYFLLIPICAFYLGLRLWHLTDSCLWFDEIFSVHAAGMSWREMFWFVAQDLIHPPLFYALLKVWISTGGESLFWLRLFPVLFSTLALIPFYLFCRELKLQNTTVITAFILFACNGALIKYAQEVRMYSVLLFFALTSMWLFVRWLNSNKGFGFLLLCNLLLIYTHYFGWFVVSAEIIAVIVLSKNKFKQAAVMLGILILSFAPWLYTLRQASQLNSDLAQNIGWMSKPNLPVLLQFALDLVEPFYFQQTNIDSSSLYFISVPLLLILFTLSAIFLFHWNGFAENSRKNFILLLIFIKLPILLAFIASWLSPYSIFGTRHLIIVFAPLAILTGLMIENIKSRKQQISAICAIFVFFAIAFIFEAQRKSETFIWCAWENLAEETKAETSENPVKVYVFEDLTAYHFWFSLRRSGKNIQIVKVRDMKDLPEDKAYFLPRGFYAVETVGENEIIDDRFYIAYRDTNWHPEKSPLVELKAKGYEVGEPKVFEAQGLKAFLVEVKRSKSF